MTQAVKTRLKHSLLVALLAASGGLFTFVSAATVPSQAFSLTSSMIDPKVFFDAEKINALYTERAMQPVWLRGSGKFQPRAEGLVKVLEESWTHGLNPENYHVTQIKEIMAARTEANQVDLDMLLTDAVIRYARDLSGLRNKKYVRADQAAFWRQPLAAEDIIQKVTSAADPIAVLRGLEPNNNLYNALRHELIKLASATEEDQAKIKIGKNIKPGKSDPAIPAIRARFGIESSSSDPAVYDDELASKIMSLQRSYGLDDDGVIGQGVIAVLNRSNNDKIRQILANMERLRWLDQTRPERYVLVNIPSATLWAVDEGDVALEMPVIVGKAARKTESFKTMITGVRLNPNWTVPPTIKRADFLPMLQNDPYALTKRGIELRIGGRSVDPGKVDWSTVGSKQLHKIGMVQAPGEDNPLGKVRVIMENPYNIYLHDTNHRDLFDKKERTLSSGCIRVSQPEKLAEFLLNKNEDMGHDNMMKLINSGRMRDIQISESIPVYITYQTIWLDTEGRLIYGRDVYGQDAKLTEMLESTKSIHIPNLSKNAQISL